MTAAALAHLPPPSHDAIAHSNQLRTKIKERIRATGPISFRDYMHTVLYEPGFGYYCAGSHRFGEAGDFVTAPTIGNLFAHTLATFLTRWPGINQSMLELGPGNGALASTLIEALAAYQTPAKSYQLLEVSPSLQQAQQTILNKQSITACSWCHTLPNHFYGTIIANELIDAFAVHRIRLSGTMVEEFFVTLHDDALAWHLKACTNPDLLAYVHQHQLLQRADGQVYDTEVNLALAPYIATLAEHLAQGLLILIDYGYNDDSYYHATRSNGTLQCHYRHHRHDDVFYWPGLQDITAHVNCSDVLSAANANQLECVVWSTQAQFLIDNGVLDLAEAHMQTCDDKQRWLISQELQRLLQPNAMGEHFKVMIFHKPAPGV